MKAGFILIFLFISLDVNAFTCRDLNGNESNIGKDFSITIPLSRTINSGDVMLFDLSEHFFCRNDNPGIYTDYMYLNNPGVTTVLDSDTFNTSVTVNGQNLGKLPISNPSSVLVYTFNDNSFHGIPIKIDYTVSTTPGKEVKINAGDTIAKIYMRFFSRPAGGNYTYVWSVLAGNSSVLTSGTCEINNGEDIKIDFGGINKNALASSGASMAIARTINVNYKCENPVSLPLKITLSAASSIFSSDLIKLTNDNLGVQMYYQGEKIKPGDSIKTSLNQGVGSNNFEFHLVKKINADVSTGPFSGNAVLVMSAD
ncbi:MULTISPECIES: fimbrial protein [Serratia]|uniref:fimbrial protein n=1 Tax=Serratia TaxID=613 RepID=UPI00094AED4D|nr:fimbrial protein [Serratia marcescens]